MTLFGKGALAVFGIVVSVATAQAQVDCQKLLYALTTAPPGVYTPEEAQVIANAYNANCLGQQQQYQQPQQYYQEQSQDDQAAQAFGEAIGGFIGGLMNRR